MKTFLHLAKENRSHLIGFALIAAFCSQRLAGFMMILVTPPALLYGLIRLGLAWRVAEKRAHYLFAIGVVVAASAVVGAAHTYQHFSAREEANSVVRDILVFREKQGRFPKNKSELGGTALGDSSKPMLRPHYSLAPDGEPSLFYPVTFIIYDTWHYDFSSQTWVYRD